MQKCFPSIFPWLSKWIYIAQVLILVDLFSISSLTFCMNVSEGWKRKKKTHQNQHHTGKRSWQKCFYRYLIKERKSLAVYEATSCKVYHETSHHFQNPVTFSSEHFGCIEKRPPLLKSASYVWSLCLDGPWLNTCLVPSESFIGEKYRKGKKKRF